ncbi:MAG: methionyl-tRNA formyltransferase [Clostridia bacterium]|nr:methionyl-tRNA formyltransferase [Clostridia bacterium]
MRVVFMGTPEFALPSLTALLEAGYPVVGVFTQSDRPQGRGGKIAMSPVRQLCAEKGLAVFQPERIKSPEGAQMLEDLRPDLCVTAAFGQILSPRNLAAPKMGTVNVHASLLPRHRGSAPINRAIEMGDAVTGVTTMLTDAGLDTGAMLLQRETPIGDAETAGELSERLSRIGAELLIETIRGLENGTVRPVPQDESRMTYEPMLRREDGKMDFRLPARVLERKVRAFTPWPGAWAELPNGRLKIHQARVREDCGAGRPGEILVSSAKEGLVVACAEGALEILEMQAPNAKRMTAKAYLMGKPLPAGTVLNGEEAQ